MIESGSQASERASESGGWTHAVWDGVFRRRKICDHGHPSGHLAGAQPGGDSAGAQALLEGRCWGQARN
eukprot:2049380-Prorocentrum_lima.AAC.1